MPYQWKCEVNFERFKMLLFSVLICLALSLSVSADGDAVSLGSENAVERESRILLQDNYYTLVSKVEHLETELATVNAEVATLKSQHAIKPHHVAFNAHLAKAFTPLANQLIVFDDVRFNMGNAYRHGVFIAPYNGTYLFSVTMCSYDNHWIHVDLLRNGKMIGQVLAGDTVYVACSSETTVTELTAGDDVIVQHHGTSGDYVDGQSFIHNSFTGMLVY